MNKYFQRIFALSEKGAQDFIKGIVATSVHFLSLMLPISVGAYFVREQLRGAQPALWAYLAAVALIVLIIYLVANWQYESTYTAIYEESAKSRIRLAETLRRLPLAFFGQKDIADLSATIMEDATSIETLFSHVVPQLYAAGISLVLVALGLFAFNWQMALALLYVVPLALLVFFLSRRRQLRIHEDFYQRKRAISDKVQEGFDMARVIHAANMEGRYCDELDGQLDRYERALIRSELLLGAVVNFSHALLYFGLPSMLIVGAGQLLRGQTDVFTFLIFLVVAARIYNPVTDFINNYAALMYLRVRIKRLREMNEMPRQGGKSSMRPQGFDLVFDGVSFAYSEDLQTLSEVSFVAKQGEVTALVGPSGGGKSTIAKLAARLWDIDGGRITLGGEDIAQVDPEVLLKHYAFVFQDVTLFDMSVLENIRIGRKGAGDEEVLRVARLARCDEFAEALPEGYHTPLGENGARLSGGERQRISIARALLKDAPVILLDEATASLDTDNESQIQSAISELIQNKTVLVIAHRMRTILDADKVLVIDGGRIVEQGSPRALLEAGGLFARMVRAQAEELGA